MKKVEFTTLDLRETIRTLLHAWSKAVPCRNIHWISRDTIERLTTFDEEAWRWKAESEQLIESLGPAPYEETFHLWKFVASQPLPRSLNHPEVLQQVDRTHVLVPIIGPQSSRVIGYVMFTDIKGKVGPRKLNDLRSRASVAARHVEFCWQFLVARDQTFLDDLTSLYNQRYMPIVFEREIGRMQRLEKKFSVLFLDIDYFKKVNDTRGHWIGSRLLVEVSRIILRSVRSCDYAFRYGGDEFVVVLVDTTPEQGQRIAERIRRAIEMHDFKMDGVSLNLTVSIGLAVFPDHAKSTVELLKLADQAMYYGKSKSRNIVFLAG